MMATYWLKNHLLTPRNGRRKVRTPVQMPSSVLSCTSRMPSPSSSRAHSRWPAVGQPVGWLRPVAGKWSYACHSSVSTINMQLCGQVFGGHPLGNATQDLDDGRAAIMALDPDGPSEEIEDRATGATAVVQDRGTMPVMGCLLGGQAMPVRAAQPLGMQDMQQEVVAGLLIQQIVERKLQHQEPSLP